MSLEDDPILRQRAGLVGTQYIHGAEILNGIEAFDDNLGARHGGGALGQVDGYDHGQHFRRKSHGDRYGKQ